MSAKWKERFWNSRKKILSAEPVGRGTAPTIALAAALIASTDENETMAVFAADHYIEDPK